MNKNLLYKYLKTYVQIIEWLETHDGQYPRDNIIKNGKVLKVKEMSQEEREERKLAIKWYSSREYEVFKACEGISLEELPPKYELYKEQIATLRKYHPIEKGKLNIYEEIIQWLEAHDGQYPRGAIVKDRKFLKLEEMSQEERDERNLYYRWKRSREYEVFKACKEIPLEDLPTEYESYREKIATLRKYHPIEKGKLNIYEEIIQWLETHDGQYPRGTIIKDGKSLKVEEMSQEERDERNLYARWQRSKEYKAFKACEGIPLEDLPTEYEPYREQIATLRRYEQIRKEKSEKKQNGYNEMIQWLEAHDGQYPRGAIVKDRKFLKVEEMTQEERDERNLYYRWQRSKEYKAFKACKGIPLENLPAEYEPYREKIATLRRYEQIRKEKSEKKQNVYNEILQWLERHDGQYPSSFIVKDRRFLKVEEMSQEEIEEKNLCARWQRSEEYKAFKACEGIPLKNLPIEYEPYREKIATLRRYKQIRKEKQAAKRMRKSVAKQIKNNERVRAELLEIPLKQGDRIE